MNVHVRQLLIKKQLLLEWPFAAKDCELKATFSFRPGSYAVIPGKYGSGVSNTVTNNRTYIPRNNVYKIFVYFSHQSWRFQDYFFLKRNISHYMTVNKIKTWKAKEH